MNPKIISIENETTGLSNETILQTLKQALNGARYNKVLLIPPDGTRAYSGAGIITAMYYEMFTATGAKVDILPALGTHAPMTREQQVAFFGNIPESCFLEHKWRDGVTAMGEVPGAFVNEVSEEFSQTPVPVEVSDYLLDKSYDRIISIGQVVPHEVAGLANFTKNIVVGCGGSGFINASHMIGAAYGTERIMGRADTPVRKLFDYAEEHYISKLPLTYILTVTHLEGDKTDILGLYIGNSGQEGKEAFRQAALLSQKRNITYVKQPIKTCVVWLDDHEFHSTWLGNKAVYRTRMAMAEGGRLIILAPGVKTFGEDAENDRLIRKYGYTGRHRILGLIKTQEDLKKNLSAAAHMIHGSPDGLFDVIYAAPHMGKEAMAGVGYDYMELSQAMELYNPKNLQSGYNTLASGEEVYYIPNPALGLWHHIAN
ncbi:MAG: lactate racemase domain-containing protein [Defluviitaleaceae bacterium]|nr:lactate racemase domain-containing protein [Defluviitaleaceae bacterium]